MRDVDKRLDAIEAGLRRREHLAPAEGDPVRRELARVHECTDTAGRPLRIEVFYVCSKPNECGRGHEH
jgi:hypothetical protein